MSTTFYTRNPVGRTIDLGRILDEMHRVAYPGEYGLGDDLTDKEAWEKIGKLVNEARTLSWLSREMEACTMIRFRFWMYCFNHRPFKQSSRLTRAWLRFGWHVCGVRPY